MSRIAIATPGAGAYDVIVRSGALSDVGTIVAGTGAGRVAVISDDAVAPLHAPPVMEALAAAGIAATLLTVRPGEAHKTRESWAALTDRMLTLGFGRDAMVVAVGGGVVGDLAGFVAATYMRGIPFVQAPTTLLAMVDASVGGKTGVDTAAGKNLVGAFHWPLAVVIDPSVLATLPLVELRNGLAEAIKHGAIADAAYLERIAAGLERIADRGVGELEPLIVRSAEIKARVVAADPLERGERAVLNFGHTIGHAIESARAYALPHGQAVAIGMVAEAAVGEAAGITEAGTAGRLRAVLDRAGLPTRPDPPLSPEDVLRLARGDKKARGGATRYALIEAVGRAARAADGGWTHAVDDSVATLALERAWRG